jgi:RNA polymerase sigma-70 factor (ECF subfamily)
MTTAEYNQSVDNHADAIYRFVLKNVRDEDDAKDVVQDTFEKVWLKCDEIPAEKAKSYLFTTAHHTMIDRLRRKNKQVSLQEHHEPAMQSTHGYSDLKEILNEALEQLPEIQRSVLLLRDYEGYSYQEIGEITNLNESQVKVYIYRARVFLKNYIVSLENVI